jgi:hypothetical protein
MCSACSHCVVMDLSFSVCLCLSPLKIQCLHLESKTPSLMVASCVAPVSQQFGCLGNLTVKNC